MKITKLFNDKRPVISFEIFPPKKELPISSIYGALDGLADLNPDFISVTYGAGGTGSNKTIEIASIIKNKYEIEALAHLTCITSNKEVIQQNIKALQENNLENVLALRGDVPSDFIRREENQYQYGVDLIKELKGYGDFDIGAAVYPEGHIECDDVEKDLQYLKEKEAAGANFLVSQLFFDNEIFYGFLEKLKAYKIESKVLAGVMPILSKKQVEKMIFMCGASLPAKVIRLVSKYEHQPELLRQAGIEYAAEQVADLIANEVDGIHIYTMNQPDIAKGILKRQKKTVTGHIDKF
ncbi:Methylenetetrahydrofolate reductase (NAD(P)H) [Alkaliphilus metalliredigens QYMF]|uniref:Methylenetetrahydrofolate reductase n=1 Tax=Alkaliphilus metalliredigens (strain QYMF) TaxID=293826 RepID=A6TTI5_ALKMQ|nr:methylenetetrahydrofolate reductase [Alkaliphilus metalliredigens]ABR49503.1 Methylenetetrahydrofolate reductase (NAD(P)H) [Alkaliphilus metalliredigens QYMF]